MERIDDAHALFEHGFLCSQSVLAAFGGPLGLEKETALKLAAGFGGGISAAGLTCGAVTGAIMVIGLAHGHASAGNKDAKANTYATVRDFIQRFEKAHGSTNCTELLGHDLGDPNGYQKAREAGLFTSLCPKLVATAAQILDEQV